MQNQETLHQLAEQAMINKCLVHMRYLRKSGEEAEYQVYPLRWDDENDEMLWVRYESGTKEYSFALRNIRDIQLLDSVTPSGVQERKLTDREAFRLSTPATLEREAARPSNATGTARASSTFRAVSCQAEWSQLLQYYIACLEHEGYLEYRFGIETDRYNKYVAFPATPPETRKFLAGGTQLSFQTRVEDGAFTPVGRFINEIRANNRLAGLCLGHMILTLSDDKGTVELAPLIFAPVTVKEEGDSLILSADEIAVSYAALAAFGLDVEDYRDLSARLAEQPGVEDAESFILNLEQELLDLLEDVSGCAIARDSTASLYYPHRANTVFETPCLFQVSFPYYGQLIGELKQLASLPWVEMPQTIRSLFGEGCIPEYPVPVGLSQDTSIYISSVNASQRQAVSSTGQFPIAVVTGPPGTGKSQLVLNVIANAVFKRQGVLLASKNNNAVDVVVERLKQSGFCAIVRVGHKNLRFEAAQMMKAVLGRFSRRLISRSEALRQESRYFERRQALCEIERQIVHLCEKDQELDSLGERFDATYRSLPNDCRNQIVDIASHQTGDTLQLSSQRLQRLQRWAATVAVGRPSILLYLKALAHFKRTGDYVRRELTRECKRMGVPEDCLGLAASRNVTVLETACRTLMGINICCQIMEDITATISGSAQSLQHLVSYLSVFSENDSTDGETHPLHEYAAAWKRLGNAWQARQSISGLRQMLADLPSVEFLQELVRRLHTDLNEHLGTEVLKSRWMVGVQELTDDLRIADEYADTLQQLAEDDQGRLQQLRRLQDKHFTQVLKCFPTWATTNLSVKWNIPLQPELFDLVVIDEASQCDIPSAIPLLYRAKQALIIGDAKQLRHVATLPNSTEVQLASLSQIPPHFSYTQCSLFDVANKSTTGRFILLNEHYRCHPEIIGFSNKVFYDDKLIIRTRPTQSPGLQRDTVTTEGLFWLNVKGHAERPKSGSAMNPAELEAVVQLLRALLDNLDKCGNPDTSIGIVTPFRLQRQHLEKRLEAYASRVRIGTAHTFQGDERDIVIMSPVLAEGLPEGSLNWISKNGHLLNVAVTRARRALIIVGSFEFCNTLDSRSPYKQLAGYYKSLDKPIFSGITELPILECTVEGTPTS